MLRSPDPHRPLLGLAAPLLCLSFVLANATPANHAHAQSSATTPTASSDGPASSPPAPAAAPAPALPVLLVPAQADDTPEPAPAPLVSEVITPPEPPTISAPDIGGLPISRLLDIEPNWSGLGSFKLLLPKHGISAYLHGITQAHFIYHSQNEKASIFSESNAGQRPTFYINLDIFFGAEFRNLFFAEAQLFYDGEDNDINFEYAQLDMRIYKDFLFLRGGKFFVPMGGLNNYPDFIINYKLPEAPLFFSQVLPSEWAEVGVQLYGRYAWAEGKAVSYAFYVVNGLEQRDGGFGGNLRDMKNNYLDEHSGDKAIGAQFQIEPIRFLSMGISGYTGVYTQDGQQRLSIGDFHMGYSSRRLTVRGEFAISHQQIPDGALTKYGGFMLISFRPIPHLEPIFSFDGITKGLTKDENVLRGTVGMNIYPYPSKVPTGSLRFAYSPAWDGNLDFLGHRVSALLIFAY